MVKNKFRETINYELRNVQLSDDVKMSVINSKYVPKKRFNFKPLVVAVASMCTVSVLTIGVGAVAFGGVSEFINGVNIMFQPVNETCTDNGIKVTVLSAGIDNIESKTMSAYITVEDTTDLDRITKDSKFEGSILQYGKGNANEDAYVDYSLVSFDEGTHVATYKLVATMGWWTTFTNKNTLLSYDINNGTTTQSYTSDVDLYALAKDNLDVGYTYYPNNGDYGSYGSRSGYVGCYKVSDVVDVDGYKSIMENIEPVQVGDDVELTAIGFLDGHLHVKLAYHSNTKTDNALDTNLQKYKDIGGITLVDENGNATIASSDSVSSLTYDLDGDTQTTELCFPRVNDISKLKGLRLSYQKRTSTYIEGEWSVTFKVDAPEG